MQELKQISENGNSVVISWPKSDEAYEYVVEAMTELFNYVVIARVENCSYVCPVNSEFVGYRILYVSKNDMQECVIDSTNMFIPPQKEYAKINIIAVKAIYNKISLSFRSEEQYDLYRLYNSSGELINETEDCIILDDFNDEKYRVEGYMKTENGYELKGASEVTSCEPMQNLQNENPLLSIVIPVYNSDMFVARTLQSILSSTFNNFEIILVDDGSDEKTKGICDWYADNFDCIKVIHKENGGLSSARNKGVTAVKAEWLSFIDSDDIVHPYMYEKLIKNAELYNTDIAISQCIIKKDFENTSNVFKYYQNKNIILMDSYEELMKKRGCGENVYFTAVWNKIIKTDIAKKLSFDEDLRLYEDTAYTPALYSYINKFVLVKDAYYIWDKRKRVTVGTLSTKKTEKPAEMVWRDYAKAVATTLKIGNPDIEIAKVYKYDVLKTLLKMYYERKYAGIVKNIIAGMIKYYVREYDLPVTDLLDSEPNSKFHTAWQEIEDSNLPEYNGTDDVPIEYYK